MHFLSVAEFTMHQEPDTGDKAPVELVTGEQKLNQARDENTKDDVQVQEPLKKRARLAGSRRSDRLLGNSGNSGLRHTAGKLLCSGTI